jgi:hypothetical protein
MHQTETQELLVCRACGAEVSLLDRTYVLGDNDALCFSCATERGGVYDERYDQWERAPSVTDLPPLPE